MNDINALISAATRDRACRSIPHELFSSPQLSATNADLAEALAPDRRRTEPRSQTPRMLPPLVLTGGPAVGKSTTARLLARAQRKGVFIDVDDVRQMVVGGHVPPWQGTEGLAQQRLGVENACVLARRFAERGFAVAVADVVTPMTMLLYRRLLPARLVVRLHVTPREAQQRAATRPAHLSDSEFTHLHAQDRVDPPAAGSPPGGHRDDRRRAGRRGRGRLARLSRVALDGAGYCSCWSRWRSSGASTTSDVVGSR